MSVRLAPAPLFNSCWSSHFNDYEYYVTGIQEQHDGVMITVGLALGEGIAQYRFDEFFDYFYPRLVFTSRIV